MGFALNPAHMKFLENNVVQMLWRRPFSKGLKDKMDYRTRQIRGGHSSKRLAGAIRHMLAARCLLSVLRLGALQADLPPSPSFSGIQIATILGHGSQGIRFHDVHGVQSRVLGASLALLLAGARLTS